jgi:hypothetical protein
MLTKLLAPLVMIPIGLVGALQIDNYGESLRGKEVMAVSENPNDLLPVPQPRAYVTPGVVEQAPTIPDIVFPDSKELYCPEDCTPCYVKCEPVRNCARWVTYTHPVRRLLSRLMFWRRGCGCW